MICSWNPANMRRSTLLSDQKIAGDATTPQGRPLASLEEGRVMTMQIDRRKFLSSGAAGLSLAFAISIDPVALAPARAEPNAPLAPNLWLTITADGTITIVSPAAVLGQGTTTTLPA